MTNLRQTQITEMIIAEICQIESLNNNGVQSLISDIRVLRRDYLGE